MSNLSPIDYQNQLNSEQLDIVLNGSGCCLVVAGPGSGKTRTLVYRVARLLETGSNPSSILLLTFTNKAAKEMKNRIHKLVGEKSGSITASTFHSFANTLLRRHFDMVGLKRNFTILDEQDSLSLLKSVVVSEHDQVKKGVLNSIKHLISLSRLKMVPIEDLFSEPDFFPLRSQADEIRSIIDRYSKIKRSSNSIDFDDLLVLLYRLLKENPKIRDFYQQHFQHILVDEFQDTDKLQSEIISLLHAEGAGLMVVGDDSQSIYSFRGAEIKNILEFKEKYNAKTLFLVKNYRSTSKIVSLINQCIAKSRVKIDKQLTSLSENDGVLPFLMSANDRVDEARILLEKFKQELADGKTIGVLFRAAYLASDLELELTRNGIQYELRGGIKFFEQRHVKDMASLIRAFHNPQDSTSILRLFTLFPRIGEKSVQRVIPKITDQKSLVVEFSRLCKDSSLVTLISSLFTSQTPQNAASMLSIFYDSFYSKYMKEAFEDHQDRVSDIDALISAAARYETVDDFLSSISLDLDTGREEKKDTKLILSTIHQAKGLEWDTVFIMGAADGLLPLERSTDLEEERRLFYVAASRARTKLFIIYPRSSGRFYEFNELSPSRFVIEIDKSYYQENGENQNGV